MKQSSRLRETRGERRQGTARANTSRSRRAFSARRSATPRPMPVHSDGAGSTQRNPNADGPQILDRARGRDNRRSIRDNAGPPVPCGREIDASWGMDVMVAPERQRKGVGELLLQTWDRHSGASLGMGLSAASHQLFRKLQWPDVGPVPCLVKPLDRHALARPGWPPLVNRVISAFGTPVVVFLRERGSIDSAVRRFEHFDARFTGSLAACLVEIRLRGASRCPVSRMEVCRVAPSSVLDHRRRARGSHRRLCCLPPQRRSAGPRHRADRLPRRPGRSEDPCNTAPIPGARCDRGRLEQNTSVRDE